MGNRYSKEEMSRIKSLIRDGLTSRNIASRLGRSEAGIRNMRHRLNLKRKVKDDIRLLQQRKKKHQAQIIELEKTEKLLVDEIESLEKRKENYQNLLNSGEESIRKMIEEKLNQLKTDKPELFMTLREQIAKLSEELLKWWVSRQFNKT